MTEPHFTQDFTVDAAEDASVLVRHKDGLWWRFEVAEKDGRRQLVHAGHGGRPDSAPAPETWGVDAYDTATRQARQRGMVD